MADERATHTTITTMFVYGVCGSASGLAVALGKLASDNPELNGSMALVMITAEHCGKTFEELESALGEFARRNPEMTDEAFTIQVQPDLILWRESGELSSDQKDHTRCIDHRWGPRGPNRWGRRLEECEVCGATRGTR
jgi:hypothetical protein